MCFAPQRRALFRHLNFQKWSEAGVFCTFWLGNVLRATTACTFSTSQLPKVVRSWCVLNILTSKCASRHNGVQFLITHLASWLRTRRFSEPTFRPSGATNHWKNAVFRDFPTFSRICIFFLLTLSLLLFFLLIFLFSLPLPCSAFHLSILSEVWLLNFLRWMYVCMYVWMNVCMYLCIYKLLGLVGWGMWHTSQKKSKHLRWLLKRRSQVDFNNWLLTDEKFKNGDVSRLLPLSWIEPETEKLKDIFYTIKVTIPMMTYNVWKTAGFSKIPIYSFMICVFSHTHAHTKKKKHTPIGSMYAIYGNIYHQYTPNVSIYTIHGSYGTVYDCRLFASRDVPAKLLRLTSQRPKVRTMPH